MTAWIAMERSKEQKGREYIEYPDEKPKDMQDWADLVDDREDGDGEDLPPLIKENLKYPPGSWRCSWCYAKNFPSTIDCNGYWGRGQRCTGNQRDSWGGYVCPLQEPAVKDPPSHWKRKRTHEALVRHRGTGRSVTRRSRRACRPRTDGFVRSVRSGRRRCWILRKPGGCVSRM